MKEITTGKITDVVFDRDGLVPVIVQDTATQEVLMMAYMNQATLEQTLNTGLMTYWSRSRNCVWVKGQTSGQFQIVKSAKLDCDKDALLFTVEQQGDGACHTGARSCFFREIDLGSES